MARLTIDQRWCLPTSGWGPGAYSLVEKHLARIERAVCGLAHSYTEERTAEGPLNVTCDDVKRAIQEYEV